MTGPMHCLHCGEEIVSTGRNFGYIHRWTGEAECRPTFASPRSDFS